MRCEYIGQNNPATGDADPVVGSGNSRVEDNRKCTDSRERWNFVKFNPADNEEEEDEKADEEDEEGEKEDEEEYEEEYEKENKDEDGQ